jgi:hypothetical protein
MVVKMLVIDSANTTKIEQNQEPIIGAAVKARLEQTQLSPAASTNFPLVFPYDSESSGYFRFNLHHHQKTKNYQWNAK